MDGLIEVHAPPDDGNKVVVVPIQILDGPVKPTLSGGCTVIGND
jgi:hypothetical protein